MTLVQAGTGQGQGASQLLLWLSLTSHESTPVTPGPSAAHCQARRRICFTHSASTYPVAGAEASLRSLATPSSLRARLLPFSPLVRARAIEHGAAGPIKNQKDLNNKESACRGRYFSRSGGLTEGPPWCWHRRHLRLADSYSELLDRAV